MTQTEKSSHWRGLLLRLVVTGIVLTIGSGRKFLIGARMVPLRESARLSTI